MTPRPPKDGRRAPDRVAAPAPPVTTPPGRRPTRSTPSGSRRAAEPREAERPSARRRRALIATVVVVVALVVVAITTRSGRPSEPASVGTGTVTTLGPEGIPLETGALLAPAATSATGQTVDGIQCDTSEQVAYHVHTHLSVYVDGHLRPLPAGVGIVEPEAEPSAAGVFYGAEPLLLLAPRPRPGRGGPHRVPDIGHVHARPVLRHLGSTARGRPRRARHRGPDRLRGRKALPWRSAVHHSRLPPGHPDRRGLPCATPQGCRLVTVRAVIRFEDVPPRRWATQTSGRRRPVGHRPRPPGRRPRRSPTPRTGR